jgi:hypothetical protein
MRKLFTNNRLAAMAVAAMLLYVTPLRAQVWDAATRLPRRSAERPDDGRWDSRNSHGKGKAKGKYKQGRNRTTVIDGRVCQVKESKDGDRATYKCRRQNDRWDGRSDGQRERDDDRLPGRGESRDSAVSSRATDLWRVLR